ncbi:hypothetical protein [Spirochaeta africana]|uniref:Uncharacterized protein n=1 Tax=Spirochaeta africana (strain ATCC 700263 / DSM 8902 / Z-7692) TaxID=889378 RepID=H9UMP9_SPIAZ|nr:hypothetical protein [Spirochaeta africana]AFG38792.1 hypothetical protein Spiaf_2768 [Spirochaeta africana DSM 8902]
MKVSLKILVRFLAAAVAAIGLLSLALFTVSVGRVGTAAVQLESGFAPHLLQALQNSILPGWIFAILFALFSALHHLKRNPLSILPAGIAAWGVLFGLLSMPVWMADDAGFQTSIRLRPVPGYLYQDTRSSFVFGSIQGVTVREVFRHDGSLPGWQRYPEGIIDPAENIVLLQGHEFPLADAHTARWSLYTVPAELTGLIADLQHYNNLLRHESWLLRVLLTGVATAVFLSLWTLVRLTRWPLLNALLMVSVVRAVLWVISAANRPVVQEFSGIVLGEVEHWLLPTVLMAVMAAVLLAWGALLAPFATWNEEVRG